MKKLLAIILAAVTTLALCIPAFAGAAEVETNKNAILGSWMLNQVMEVKEGEEPALLEKEENQSLYGAGKSIFTFDEDGYAHCVTFDAGDMVDAAATWKETAQNEIAFTEEDGMTLTFNYNNENDTLHRTFAEEDRTLDFIYNRAIVGEWKLDTVLEMHPGDAPETLDPEGNQSLYAAAKNSAIFNADGTAVEIVRDGADEMENKGTWKMTAPDKFICEQDGTGGEMEYFRVDDTLFRDIKDETPEAAHPYLRFIFTRVQ